MKVLLVGLGGIGSFLVPLIDRAFLDSMDMDMDCTVDIADPDVVEPKNAWQNFVMKDMGVNKAVALKRRYPHIDKAIQKTIFGVNSDLKGYDIIVMAVDNFPTREAIIRHCYANNIEFIDLRAEGNTAFAMPKTGDLLDDLNTLDLNDKKSGSCQVNDPLKTGYVDYGCKVSAAIGLVMLMNLLNGEKNRKTVVKL